MPAEPRTSVPAALTWAARFVGVEGALLLLYGVVDAFHASSGRVLFGLTAAVFFVAYGVGLGFCAWGFAHLRRWARGPVLFTQLAMLGFAWNFGQAHRWVYVGVLAVLAIATLACLVQPAAVEALEEGHQPDDDV